MKKLFCLAVLVCAVLLNAAVIGERADKPLAITGIDHIDEQNVLLHAYMERTKGNSYSVKPWTDTISLPPDLIEQGFRLIRRDIISKEGTFWMLDEDMEGFGYTCVLVMTLPESLGGKPVKIKMDFLASKTPDETEKLPQPQITSPVNNGVVKFRTPDYYPVFSYTGTGTVYRMLMNGHNGDEVIHRVLYAPSTRELSYKSTVDGCSYEVLVQQADNTLRWSEPARVSFKIVWGFRECTWCNGEGKVRCDRCYGSGQIYQYGTPSGYVKCETCNGTGKVECRWCWGQGWTYK
ncbi:MAG: hypothetical protein PHQ23_07920 [Candidatus Wallbacteria bacterium]|nr:hypothetical protein [Candidatus Wallbacteria bacterium]